MNLTRTCASCIRTTTRTYSVAPQRLPIVQQRVGGFFRSFSQTSPALKKASKQRSAAVQEEFEDEEFQEDEFDDLDSSPSNDSTPVQQTGLGRDQRHADTLSRVQQVVSLPLFRLASSTPSTSLLTALLTRSSPETLPITLETIKEWRKKRLPLLSDRGVELLVKRLSKLEGPEGGEGQRVIRVLADRKNYGVEINDIRSLYPLFIKFSKPTSSSESSSLESDASTCFDLLTLASQHTPSTVATDSFAHLSTLAVALTSSRLSKSPISPKIDQLISHLMALGEDYILQQVTNGSVGGKREREIMRFRAMRVTEELRLRQVKEDEEEWFAHLTERLVSLTKK
ncbi:uncharacterized protein JCM6883_007098 [Sporobolomyces salmoneus]|uniref:uncharacterized protein n=1 Tax=Sporobolomyces salmoneus TaxID=183962 RepID=UPI00317359FC